MGWVEAGRANRTDADDLPIGHYYAGALTGTQLYAFKLGLLQRTHVP